MKHPIKFVSLALCAAVMLSVPAIAADPAPTPEPAPITAAAQLASVELKGAVTKQEDGSLLINDAVRGEVVVHLTEGVPFVDGTTGLPMDITQLKDGDILQIWVGPAMTMSLPPQTTAEVLVGNLPAANAPQYAEITAPAILPAPAGTERRLPIAGGEQLTILDAAEISPYLNKRQVTLEDLTPGAQILAWTNSEGKVDKIVLFPYAYSGYMTVSEDGAMCIDGEELPVKGRMLQGEEMTQLYLPLRVAAEAAGYDVDWVSGKGAVVSQYGEELFSVQAGSDTAQTSDGEQVLLGSCVIDGGVTYLPADDLARLLSLYYYTA